MARRSVVHWTWEDLTGCSICTRLWKTMVETAKRFPQAFGTSYTELLARASREAVSGHLKNLLAWGVATHQLPKVAGARSSTPEVALSRLYGPSWLALGHDLWTLAPWGAEPVWMGTPPDGRQSARASRAREALAFLSEPHRLRSRVTRMFTAVHDRGAPRLKQFGRVLVSGSRFPDEALHGFVDRTAKRKDTSLDRALRYERIRTRDLRRLMRFASRHEADLLVVFPEGPSVPAIPPFLGDSG